jgi:hypothetical protein
MKKIAIMQPYFFPYLGYISLIKHTDRFILFDTAQFIRHGWIERNRVLKQGEGWLYIKVPLVKFEQTTPIKDCYIDNTQDWKQKILAQLAPYKKNAPYYQETIKVINEVFSKEYQTITQLNKQALISVCNYLGIQPSINVFSEMDLTIDSVNAPDEWALNISKSLEAEEYWNPPGGQEFFSREKYENANIGLFFQKVNLSEYSQKRETFEPGLSIIDVMMFNSIEDINKMLDDYELK